MTGETAHIDRARLAAIVIGRNEGQRLVKCLESVQPHFDRVIYVDSGSIDGSAEHAETLGTGVVRLTGGPFTAARGRQAGLDELERLGSAGIDYVQFIDGDCLLDPTWIPEAIAALDANAKLAGVCARRREIHTATSFYSRMIDIDWDIPPGEVPFVGGDWLARWQAIREVGGWSIDLIAGEEPDLCFRMRDRGWMILRLAREQTRHDIAMSSFRPYWRRAMRSGYAYAEVGWKHRGGSGREWLRPTIGIVIYGLLLPIALVLLPMLAAIVPSLAWALGIVALLVLLVWAKSAFSMLRYCHAKGVPWGTAAWYTGLNIVCKTAAAIGVVKYLIASARGTRQELIEYKGAEATPVPGASR
jgi:glycosyltransferase involved in cell wall biosynthesis